MYTYTDSLSVYVVVQKKTNKLWYLANLIFINMPKRVAHLHGMHLYFDYTTGKMMSWGTKITFK